MNSRHISRLTLRLSRNLCTKSYSFNSKTSTTLPSPRRPITYTSIQSARTLFTKSLNNTSLAAENDENDEYDEYDDDGEGEVVPEINGVLDLQNLSKAETQNIQKNLLELEETFVLQKAPKSIPTDFEPETFTAESLITNRIATASSITPASQATLQAAIAKLARRDDTSFSFDDEMARQLARGEKLIRFRDADEMARIVALTEEHAMDTARKRNVRKLQKLQNGQDPVFESPKPVDFQSIPAKNRQEIVDKVLKGKYSYGSKNSHNRLGEEAKPISDIKTALHLNGTFTPRGIGGFFGILGKYLPNSPLSKP